MSDPNHVEEGSSTNSDMQDVLFNLAVVSTAFISKVYLVVDGLVDDLDECYELKKTVQALQDMCDSASSICFTRIHFVSQRLPEIAASIGASFHKRDLG